MRILNNRLQSSAPQRASEISVVRRAQTFAAAMMLLALGATSQGVKAEPTNTEATAATESNVNIDNFTFTPPTLTVAPGTKVTWTNHDDIPHTIVSSAQGFHSKALDTDDAFSFTFATSGEYEYFCSLHPKMKGIIIVKPPGA